MPFVDDTNKSTSQPLETTPPRIQTNPLHSQTEAFWNQALSLALSLVDLPEFGCEVDLFISSTNEIVNKQKTGY